MFPRGEWLRLQTRRGRRARAPFALFYLAAFEAYYQHLQYHLAHKRMVVGPKWRHLDEDLRCLTKIIPGE